MREKQGEVNEGPNTKAELCSRGGDGHYRQTPPCFKDVQ